MATTKFKMLAVVVLIGGGPYSARAEKPQEKSAKSAAHAQDRSVPPAQLKAAQDEPGSKMELTVRELRDKLAMPVTTTGIPKNTPLSEALDILSDRYGVQILTDEQAFRAVLHVDSVLDQPVTLPKMANVPLSRVLGLLLPQVEATFLVRPKHLEVVPVARAWPAQWITDRGLAPTVLADFHGQPLDLALAHLSHATGITVILDGRIADKAKQTMVTATLNNVPLDTAVRLLADLGGLHMLVQDNLLYVTSPGNAKKWETANAKSGVEPKMPGGVPQS